MFYKEILKLKEQLFRKKQMEDGYNPDEIDYFNPTAWMEQILGEDANPDDDIETILRKASLAIAKLNESFEEEKKRLEQNILVYYFIFFYLCLLLFYYCL